MNTPIHIVEWCAVNYGCDVDLAASYKNKKFHYYFSDEKPNTVQEADGYCGNALIGQWGVDEDDYHVGFCNPPYADLTPWLDKAIVEAETNQFISIFLIPTFNGDKWARLAYQATEIIFIEGRINFIKESDGRPLKGNGRGSMLCVFSPFQGTSPATAYITLDEIIGK